MSRKVWLVVFLIIVSLFSTGCLSMIYYPSRVLDSGGVCVGLGTHSEGGWADDYELKYYSSLFFRVGFDRGFDGGIELRGYQIFPCTGVISIRKQFNFNAIVIDGITLGIGVGFLHSSSPPIEWNGSMCFLKKGFSLTITTARNGVGVLTENYSYLINSTYAKASYEFSIGKHFLIMPFVSYRHSNDYKTSGDEVIDYWKRNKLGIGLSLAFKSK